MITGAFQTINDYVKELREILSISTPVDMSELLSKLQVEVGYHKVTALKETRVEALSKGPNKYRLVIPEYETDTAKRVALAHGLGHLFLHMGYNPLSPITEENQVYHDTAYYRLGHSKEEYEATEFAQALLMPITEFYEVSKFHRSNGTYNVDAIATYFNVPTAVVKQRGIYLGLFEVVI